MDMKHSSKLRVKECEGPSRSYPQVSRVRPQWYDSLILQGNMRLVVLTKAQTFR